MVYEIVGARVMGPYFGTSVFVWTSLIGVVMGSLAAGYWLGGLLSLRNAGFKTLALVLTGSALFILFTAAGHSYVLDRIVKYIPDLRPGVVLASIVLLGPASIGFGMVLPLGVKIAVKRMEAAGGTIGNLYAMSTAGSILGTFLAGFFLVPELGFSRVVFLLVGFMLLLGISAWSLERNLWSSIPLGVLAVLWIVAWTAEERKEKDYIDVDTQYSRVLIFNTTDKNTNRPIKMLRVNDENSSAMFLDGEDGLVFEVLKYYRLIEHFVPSFREVLMIGGSGYAFPKDYLRRFPEAKMDVVEIDPGLTRLAKEHFNLVEDPRLSIIHEDGRTFLNTNTKKYDAVLMDAYKSLITIPYQLTTLEAVQKIHASLQPEGAVFANVISSLDPANNQFLLAEIATYSSVFPQVYLFAVQYPEPDSIQKTYFQNFMLVGMKSDKKIGLQSSDPELNGYLQHFYPFTIPAETPVLTDEFAPVEFFASRALK